MFVLYNKPTILLMNIVDGYIIHFLVIRSKWEVYGKLRIKLVQLETWLCSRPHHKYSSYCATPSVVGTVALHKCCLYCTHHKV